MAVGFVINKADFGDNIAVFDDQRLASGRSRHQSRGRDPRMTSDDVTGQLRFGRRFQSVRRQSVEPQRSTVHDGNVVGIGRIERNLRFERSINSDQI